MKTRSHPLNPIRKPTSESFTDGKKQKIILEIRERGDTCESESMGFSGGDSDDLARHGRAGLLRAQGRRSAEHSVLKRNPQLQRKTIRSNDPNFTLAS
ncbi:hypothetical protein B296_00041045 [Ensete ventricosum]|uniref:Uncharacterized protein n=1 Tax=Ensete ventricosum TaxID=4639 RepID=A0A426Y4T1_ENSVE|nr:hypothetical protein B296_00041045 [Ensete ventricosum]